MNPVRIPILFVNMGFLFFLVVLFPSLFVAQDYMRIIKCVSSYTDQMYECKVKKKKLGQETCFPPSLGTEA